MRTLALRCLASLGLILALAATAGAQQWRSEGPFLATASDIAVDPKSPDTLYLATHGGGVWRSEDGGKTWTLPGDEMTSRQVEWVMVDPGKSTTVWAGVHDAGMWRSLDRGGTWKTVKPDNDEIVGLRPAFAPSAPANIFVPSTNLHWRSPDDGKTWTSFRVSGQDSYAMAVHPTNPKIVISGGRGENLNVSRSQDGGKTWRAVGVGIRKTSVHRVLIDPSHPSTVYAYAGFHDLFKSTDMGDNFEPIETGVRDATDEIDDLDLDPTIRRRSGHLPTMASASRATAARRGRSPRKAPARTSSTRWRSCPARKA
jgi:photosystem II stability/assembly factor-like uncharacterized protein